MMFNRKNEIEERQAQPDCVVLYEIVDRLKLIAIFGQYFFSRAKINSSLSEGIRINIFSRISNKQFELSSIDEVNSNAKPYTFHIRIISKQHK